MANEVLFSSTGDLRLAEVINRFAELLLADRASIWGHPALVYLGDLSGSGSTVVKQGQVGLDGYDEMAAVAEGSSTSNTALTDDSTTVTIARQALQYQISTLAEMTSSIGLDAERLAASMLGSAAMRFTTMIAALSSGFSSSVGTTTVDMSVDDWRDAIITLQLASNDMTRALAMLHPRQVSDLQISLAAETGAVALLPATADLIQAKGPGFAGSLLGVDIFNSGKVPTANAGADRGGMMFVPGGIVWADGSPRRIRTQAGAVLNAGTRIWTELERDSSGGLTKLVGNYYVGVAEGQDGMGVEIISDA